MKFFRFLLALPLLLASAFDVHAQVFQPEIKVSASDDKIERSPDIQVSSNGHVYISWFQSPMSIYMATSADGGRSFGAPVLVSAGISKSAYLGEMQRKPAFVIDKNGALHLVWGEPRGGKQNVWHTRSVDHGQTWSEAKCVWTNPHVQDYPTIVVDSTNTLVVAFLDASGIETATGPMNLGFVTSSDGGDSWSEPRSALKDMPMNGGTCDCCRLLGAAGKSGELYFAYRTNIRWAPDSNERMIFFASSTDRGATWNSARRAHEGTVTINGCPTSGAQGAMDESGTLHYVIRNTLDGTDFYGVYYAKISASTEGIPTSVKISSEEETGDRPTLAIQPNGRIMIAYLTSMSNGHIVYRSSDDNGLTWSSPATIEATDANQLYPVLAASESGFFLAWQDTRNDGGDIYFATTTLFSGVRQERTPASMIRDGILRFENPVTDASVYDLLGREVRSISNASSVDLHGLMPGSYVVVTTTADRMTSMRILVR